MQPGHKRQNKEVNCSLSKKEHAFPVVSDTALCSQVISTFWCARTLHHTLHEYGRCHLWTQCWAQWHHSWKLDAMLLYFTNIQTFPRWVTSTLYGGSKVSMRISRARSSWSWQHKLRKTWDVPGLWWLIHTQFFFLHVGFWKWTACSSSA